MSPNNFNNNNTNVFSVFNNGNLNNNNTNNELGVRPEIPTIIVIILYLRARSNWQTLVRIRIRSKILVIYI